METNSRSEIEKLLEGEGRRLIQGVRHTGRDSQRVRITQRQIQGARGNFRKERKTRQTQE